MSWLSGETIKRKIQRNADEATWKAFDNVYSVDDLPSSIPHYPFFIVLNTHPHNLKGEHWKAIFINSDRRGELFDSLALVPNIPTQQWLNKHTRQWKRNLLPVQHPDSASCGAFVVYFILNRLHVRRFESFNQKFSINPHVNERLVRNFYNDLK